MKVRELQKHLSKLDSELDVVRYREDESPMAKKRGFILFDILADSTVDAERHRLDDGTPYLKFERGPASVAMAALEVISDF